VTIHQAVAEGVEMVLKQSAASRSLDNITVVILGFSNYENTLQKLNEGHTLKEIKEQNTFENKGRKFYDKFDDSQVIPEDFNFI
jgi:serine/threonine protein phosphatase PrpC